jgi:hypothetical protein
MGISDFRALAEPADFTVLVIRLIFYPQSVKRQNAPQKPFFRGRLTQYLENELVNCRPNPQCGHSIGTESRNSGLPGSHDFIKVKNPFRRTAEGVRSFNSIRTDRLR